MYITRFGNEGRVKQIQLGDVAGITEEILLRSEYDRVGLGQHFLDIQSLADRKTQTTALAWRIERDAVVLPQLTSMNIDEESGLSGSGCFLFDKGSVVAMTDEANFLTFLELVGRQAQAFSFAPDVGLAHASNRKE